MAITEMLKIPLVWFMFCTSGNSSLKSVLCGCNWNCAAQVEEAPQSNGLSQEVMNGVAATPALGHEGYTADYSALLSATHTALKGRDPASAAGSLCQVLQLVKEALDQGTQDRYTLAQVCGIFRVST